MCCCLADIVMVEEFFFCIDLMIGAILIAIFTIIGTFHLGWFFQCTWLGMSMFYDILKCLHFTFMILLAISAIIFLVGVCIDSSVCSRIFVVMLMIKVVVIFLEILFFGIGLMFNIFSKCVICSTIGKCADSAPISPFVIPLGIILVDFVNGFLQAYFVIVINSYADTQG